MAKEKLTEAQYEEFDYITDFYMPIKEVEDKYNSPHLKRLRDAKIDAYEYLGLEKVEGVGEIQKIQDKSELAEAKKTVGQHLLNFAKDLPEGTVTELGEAGANVLNNVVQLFGFGSNMMFKGTKFDEVSQTTTEFAQGYNKGTEEFIAKLNKYKQENDVNGASELVGELGIDIAAFVPINKMLKKAGVPDKVSTPLSFGLAWGFTGGDEETEKGMFIDSEVIHGVNEILGILPDTPESEVAELVGNTFEGTIWGGIGDQLVRAFKIIKNNVPAFINQQTATSAGGTAIATEGAIRAQENADQNQDFSQEKKTLNFDDQSNNKTMMEMFYGLDKTQQEKISAATGYPVDQIKQAGFLDTVVKEGAKKLGPVFKSIVRETAEKLPNKGTGEQMFNQLKNTPGVKSSELKWTGLDEFLKGKKNVTKEEVQEYLKATSIDVAEVKFSSKAEKPTKALQKVIDDFESKYQFERTNPPNYDVYQTFIGKKANTQARGTMDFQTLKSVIGDDVAADSFEVVDETFGTVKALRYKNLNADDPNILIRPRGDDFFIDPIDLEKYKIERLRRMQNLKTGSAKFDRPDLVEPGGEDYTELVFKIKKGGMDVGIPTEVRGNKLLKTKEDVFSTTETREMNKSNWMTTTPYKNPSHMDTKSEIAHVRFKTRNLNDMKVLTVEEMQSDFATAVRKGQMDMPGFDDLEKQVVQDFPFKNTWYEMTVKRLIRYAADNGFDAVAIPKGSVIQDRYGLTRRIDDFEIGSFDPVRKEVGLEAKDQNGVLQISEMFSFDKVEKEFGKDVLDRIIAKGNKIKSIKDFGSSPNDALIVKLPKTIKIGGEGKTQLYNVAIPKFMKKYGKKWNAKVYDDEIGTIKGGDATLQEMPVTIIKLTPEMKKAVQTDGQALFNIFGLGGVGASVVSDSIENNNISQTTN